MILRPLRSNNVSRNAEAWRPLPFAPNQSCLVLLAAIAHATLGEGDDCLGYTIIANRP